MSLAVLEVPLRQLWQLVGLALFSTAGAEGVGGSPVDPWAWTPWGPAGAPGPSTLHFRLPGGPAVLRIVLLLVGRHFAPGNEGSEKNPLLDALLGFVAARSSLGSWPTGASRSDGYADGGSGIGGAQRTWPVDWRP